MANLDLEKLIFQGDENTYIIKDATARQDVSTKAEQDGSNIIAGSKWNININGHADADIASTEKGASGGVAELDENGLVPSSQLPFQDTKNTAGATDSSSKLFLIGATTQTENPQTYSQDTAYIGTDGNLYSGGLKVMTAIELTQAQYDALSHAQKNNGILYFIIDG